MRAFFIAEIFPLNKTSGGDSYCPDNYVVSLVRPVPSLGAVVKMVFLEHRPSFHFILLSAASMYPESKYVPQGGQGGSRSKES